MDSSARAPKIHSTLQDTYNAIRVVNEDLQKVQVDILRASSIWSLYQKDGSESSDLPEYWVDSKDQNIWSDKHGMDAWAREAKSKGLFDSKLALKNELKALGDLKMNLEDTQRTLRLSANQLSQPTPGSTHILDLPDEILARVFDFAEGPRPDIPSVWSIVSRDMKNCRLTCQDFYRVSSRHFLRSVAVDFSASSISRFEEISRHPIISKGVRVVRAVLHFYDPHLSDNFLEFISYHADELEEQLEAAEWMREGTDIKVPEDSGPDAIVQAKRVLESWRRISSDLQEEPLTEEDQTHLIRLKLTHQKYQMLCSNQERLSKSGEFLQKVAAGIARMPCARILYLHDRDHAMRSTIPLFGHDNINVPIYEPMLKPMDYYAAYQNGFTPRLYDTITQLPMAVKNSGAWLERIYIDLSYLDRPSNLLPSPEIQEQLPLAMQRLRQFSFRCKRWMDEESTEEVDENMLGEILTPFLNTPSIQEFTIDMLSQKESEETCTFNIGKVMGLERWENLSELFLRDIAFHLSEFRNFVGRIRAPFFSFGLEHVRLLSGTWAEVLDILRGRSIKIMSLRDPLGAECNVMSPDELSWAFGRGDILARTEAELYITKITHLNPLRK